MWKLLKAEFGYNKSYLILLGVVLILYTLFNLADVQILTGPEFAIDYWGGIIGAFIYLVYLMIWKARILERRERYHSLIPISLNATSIARLFFTLLPMLYILLYLLFIHYLLVNTWHEETGSIIMQAGMCFLLIMLILLLRDIWIMYRHRSVVLQVLFCSIVVLFVVCVIIWIFIKGRLLFYSLLGWNFGKIMFFFFALLLSPLLFISFNKRKSFLD